MEVILKKTKITGTVLKQALRSKEIDLLVGEILGWCVYKGFKYMVCYRSDISGLSIYPMFKEIVVEKRNGSEDFLIRVNTGNQIRSVLYETENEHTKNTLIETLNKAKHNAEIRGQFFI